MTSAHSRRPNFKFNYEIVVLYLHVYNFVGISYCNFASFKLLLELNFTNSRICVNHEYV